MEYKLLSTPGIDGWTCLSKMKALLHMIGVWNALRTKRSGESDAHSNTRVTSCSDYTVQCITFTRGWQKSKIKMWCVWRELQSDVQFQISSCWPHDQSKHFNRSLKHKKLGNSYLAVERRRTWNAFNSNMSILGKRILSEKFILEVDIEVRNSLATRTSISMAYMCDEN